jgi:hypothetical protein
MLVALRRIPRQLAFPDAGDSEGGFKLVIEGARLPVEGL